MAKFLRPNKASLKNAQHFEFIDAFITVLAAAGLTDENVLTQVRTISFQQEGANGGARVYDMYVKVPEIDLTGISTLTNVKRNAVVTKVIENGRLMIRKNGVNYNVQGQIIK